MSPRPRRSSAILSWYIASTTCAGIGTSGVVYPAAGFAQIAAECSNCHLIEINLEATVISRQFDEHIVGPVSVELPKLVERLLAS